LLAENDNSAQLFQFNSNSHLKKKIKILFLNLLQSVVKFLQCKEKNQLRKRN